MGRHKQFNREEITNKALLAFWKKGYLDTSLKDLEEATGVFKPVLYSEFGDKAGLFLECINYYRANYARERVLKGDPKGWHNIASFLKPVLNASCERSCFEVDVFSRDIPILEREVNTCVGKAIDHIPPLIRSNLVEAGVDTLKLEALTTTIFTFYCGLSVLAKSHTNEQLCGQVDDFLDYVCR